MKKLFYKYSNGEYSIHSNFISSKTINKEANGAEQVSIYKCNDYQLDELLDGYSAGEYITTYLLK